MNEVKRAYDLMRGYVGREWDRVMEGDREVAMGELYSPTDPVAKVAPTVPIDEKAEARRILGVRESDGIDQIDAAFHSLVERSDPKNFGEGSESQKQALQIQQRVKWAYGKLIEDLDGREKRFRSLEIE